MEPQKSLNGIEKYKPNLAEGPQKYFEKARLFSEIFYSDIIASIWEVNFENISPQHFWREFIWVVHATGFSAKAVGKFMPKLVIAYGNYWELADKDFQIAFESVKLVCNNFQKSKAIWKTAKILKEAMLKYGSWPEVQQKLFSSPEKLSELPYIGKITCFHLARNIGLLEFVKPDLHLVRMAKYWGFPDCVEMCEAVCPSGMPLGIVDLIFWITAREFGTLDIRGSNR